MTAIELLTIIQQVTGFSLTHLRHLTRNELVLDARYVFVLLMVEEGYTHKDIADMLMRDLTVIRYSRRKADKLLRSDKRFKALYLNCITSLTQIEDAN